LRRTPTDELEAKAAALADQFKQAEEQFAAATRWATPSACHESLILAGNVLFAGGTDQVIAVDAATGKTLWTGHVEGTAKGLAAAQGRLFASTDKGLIYSFGPEGSPQSGAVVEPVDERFAHTEVYKAHPEVHAVAHAHPSMATAFGIAGVNILPVGNRGAIFAPKVPILEFDKQIDTPERGRMVVQALGGGCAVVLKNHGVVVTSDTIENVCITLFSLEHGFINVAAGSVNTGSI